MSRWRFTVSTAVALLAAVMLVGCGYGTKAPADGKTVLGSDAGPKPKKKVEEKKPEEKKPDKKAEDKKTEEPKKEKKFREPDILFVPTPQGVVDKMLELAKVKKTDLVYDLGCGDGRIVVTVAKKYGCKAIGFDIDPDRVKEATENVKKNKVEDLVQIKHDDVFTLDLSEVDVVTLYLLPSLNVKLIPQLKKLKPGSRIVSHDFDMQGVEPTQKIEIKPEDSSRSHDIYLWVVDKEGKIWENVGKEEEE